MEKKMNNSFDCFNHCPYCNAGENDINWGEKDWGDDSAWQDATCKKCGCEFSEVYNYASTEILESSPVQKKVPDK